MGCKDLVDIEVLESFLETTKSKYGGFGKAADSFPDVMHSYMGLAATFLFKTSDFCTFLGIRKRHVREYL